MDTSHNCQWGWQPSMDTWISNFMLISWHLSTKPSGFYELHLPFLWTFWVPIRSLYSWFNLSPYEIILTFIYKIQMKSMRLKPLHQLISYGCREYLPCAISWSIVFEMHWSLQSSSDMGILRQIGWMFHSVLCVRVRDSWIWKIAGSGS